MNHNFTGRFKNIVLFVFTCLLTFALQTNIFAKPIKLVSQISPGCATTSILKYADVYADGNLAVMGSFNCRGAFIFNIENPKTPTLASWYNPGANQQFLEAIVIGNRAYFGSGNGGGVHIVDVSNPTSPVLLGLVNSISGNGHNSIHEMMILNQGGQTYLIENFNGFSSKIIKIINITNPAAPVFVRDLNPTEAVWVHAMHIRGNRMFTSGWGSSTARGRTEIYDISNIATQAPTLLGFIEDTAFTTSGNSMHSSWSSEDGNYLYSCRETTGSNGTNPADLRVYDIQNPASPLLVKKVSMIDLGINAVSPHNPVVMGNKLYVSWYQAGTVVFDISNPIDPKNAGIYDTYAPEFVPSDFKDGEVSDEPWDMVCGNSSQQNLLPTSYNGNWAVYPFLGEDKVILADLTNGLFIVDVTSSNLVSDFDGDKKTDLSTFTQSTGNWKIETSSNNNLTTTSFGTSGDKIVAADYDGDGKSDISVFRPSNGVWYRLNSSNGAFVANQFGTTGDIAVPSDYDFDGKADVAVFRPSSGIWYINQSTQGFRATQWGISSDKILTGDFDGDGKSDVTVFRNGIWYILQSSNNIPLSYSFGLAGDIPISGDFDGDSKTDFAVYRPSNGFWYRINSSNGSFTANQFGISTDTPISADYDGDGKTDIAVFRSSNNNWYRLNSSNGVFVQKNFGESGDVPSPSSFNAQ